MALVARAMSQAGDAMAVTALMLRAHDSGHGPWAVTALLVASALPVIVLAGVTGRVADSLDSRVVLLRASMLQALACVALAFVAPLWATLVLVAVAQAGFAFSTPVWGALVPRIVGDELLPKAVALQRSLATVAGVLGGALGGLLVGWKGSTLVLLVDAATFAVLAGAAASLRTRRVPYRGKAPVLRGWRAVTEGLVIMARSRLVLRLFSFLAPFVLVVESANVAEVFLIRDALSGSAASFGLVTACLGLGGVLGGVLAARARDDRQRVRNITAGLIVSGVAIAALGVAPTVGWVAGGYLVVGALNIVTTASLWPMLTLRTADAQRGRVLASTNAVMTVTSLVALAVGGVVVSSLGPRRSYLLAGGLALLVGLALFVKLRRDGLEELLEERPKPGRAAVSGGPQASDVREPSDSQVVQRPKVGPPPIAESVGERHGARPGTSA